MFSYEFCEIFKNTFFTEHLRKTASANVSLLSIVQTPITISLNSSCNMLACVFNTNLWLLPQTDINGAWHFHKWEVN